MRASTTALTVVALLGLGASASANEETNNLELHSHAPRQLVEGISVAVALLANSPVIKCFSSCAAFSTQVSVACSGEAIFTESTFLECLCQDSKIAIWEECGQCIVDNMDDGTSRQEFMKEINDSYGKECPNQLNLVDNGAASTSSALPVFTMSTMASTDSDGWTFASTMEESTSTTSTTSTSSTTSATSSTTTTSTSVSTSSWNEAHPGRGRPTSLDSLTSTSATPSSPTELAPVTVFSTAIETAAAASTTPQNASGAGRLVVSALGAGLLGAVGVLLA